MSENKTNEEVVKNAIRGQFGGAIEMLRQSIHACPEELWDDREEGIPFWHIAYHTIFFMDLYSGDSPEMFEAHRPPSFHAEDMQNLGKTPTRTLSREQVVNYLEESAAKSLKIIDGLKLEDLGRQTAFHWLKQSVGETLLYNLRHVNHHVGQLNLILRQGTGASPGWIRRVGE